MKVGDRGEDWFCLFMSKERSLLPKDSKNPCPCVVFINQGNKKRRRISILSRRDKSYMVFSVSSC